MKKIDKESMSIDCTFDRMNFLREKGNSKTKSHSSVLDWKFVSIADMKRIGNGDLDDVKREGPPLQKEIRVVELVLQPSINP